jgi:hypothetical protein
MKIEVLAEAFLIAYAQMPELVTVSRAEKKLKEMGFEEHPILDELFDQDVLMSVHTPTEDEEVLVPTDYGKERIYRIVERIEEQWWFH